MIKNKILPRDENILKPARVVKVSKEYFKKDAVIVAKGLLGKILRYGDCTGIVVETEAYKSDPASHAYKITPRSEIMLKTHGHWYIYLIYGMYHCLNITTNKKEAGAVLIRALEPISGIELMKKRRGITDVKNLCSGPGKLCEAFAITKRLNRSKINKKIEILDLVLNPKAKNFKIKRSNRIGVKEGKDLLWRFYIKGNEFVSKSK